MAKTTTRRDYKLALLELEIDLRRKIEVGLGAFDSSPAAVAERVARVQNDFRFFAETYFPHYTEPSGKKSAPSLLHLWLFEHLPAMVDCPEGVRDAIAAPRGEAKSTFITQFFTIWCVLTERKRFIPIIMDVLDQGVVMVEGIKAELAYNPRLAMDFPEHTGKTKIWAEGVAVTAGGAKFQAYGAGKKIRGIRHGAQRPDLIIVDDIENDDLVKRKEQRDKRESWLRKTVLSLGPPDGSMDLIVVGTIIHHDSVLARLRRDRLWRGRTFRSIVVWPDDMALWDQWEVIYKNEGIESSLPRAFYEAHKAAMDAGAVVTWPSVRSLYDLMVKRAQDGHAAFDSEQQNDPTAGDAAPLASSIVQFGGPIIFARRGWLNYGSVDPSLGRQGGSGDPSAVLGGAYSRELQRLEVLHASIKRRIPDKIIEDVIDLQAQMQCVVWAVESTQFQEFFRTTLIRRSLERKVPVPARAVKPNADKVLRIEAMQPFLAKNIVIHASCVTLIDQLKQFPLGDHDDGPDALQMLWMAASSGVGKIEFFSGDDLANGTGPGDGADDDDDDLVSMTRQSW